MKTCSQDSDCRTADNYFCADAKQAPWSAIILDDNQAQRVCIPRPVIDVDAAPPASSAGVCGPGGDLPAPYTPTDSGAFDAGAPPSDAAVDAGSSEGGLDGGADADAAAVDATVGDASGDATVSDAGDAGVSDATTD
jgi:hypothetical protein